MSIPRAIALAATLALAAGRTAAQTPQGTAFTYQGRLSDAGSPADGAFDFRFILYDAAVGGSQVGPIVSRDDVVVTGGLFTVSLDFGSSFGGSRRWLDLSVRPGASTGTYTPIAPRHELTSTPSALFSAETPWTGVADKPAGFADGIDDDVVGGLACGGGEVAKWNGTLWACANDLVNAGTVTSVGAGAGLSGGPITSSGTLSVAFGGGGAASTVARSDHNHHGQLWAGASGTGLTVESAAGTGNGILGRAGMGGGYGRGVIGEVVSTTGAGVYGHATATTGSAVGVLGLSDSTYGTGVYGEGTELGVRGQSATTFGSGVFGWATNTTGATSGVQGWSESSFGSGVLGTARASTGDARGVTGHTLSAHGIGVYGLASAGTGVNTGVYGTSHSSIGQGVIGFTSATVGTTRGVYGASFSPNGRGVEGHAGGSTGASFGVYGSAQSSAGMGVYGEAEAATGSTVGLHGVSHSSQGRGVLGVTTATSGPTVGVYGLNSSSAGYAGFFNGRVHVAGTLSKAAGSFRIDHPLDPERKYLYHSFVESPDMKNVYDGVVTTDADGFATVTMPEWFEALNRDFRYQLTVIGKGEWAHARVFREVEANTFVVQTDRPRIAVSWQVTGIRRDSYAEKHRIPVEEDKPLDEQGHPLEPGGGLPIPEP
jgi:hypothetical protein